MMHILMRHAKSAYPPGVGDHDRPLSPRGQRNARVAREWLHTHQLIPARAWVSTSARTRETWQLLDPEGEIPVTFLPELYLARSQTILQICDDALGDAHALVLAHHPGIHEAAEQLGGVRIERFPTSAIAVCDAEGLREFVVPR